MSFSPLLSPRLPIVNLPSEAAPLPQEPPPDAPPKRTKAPLLEEGPLTKELQTVLGPVYPEITFSSSLALSWRGHPRPS
ncbi:MAG: hypothetical protein RLZZ244_2337 [Verrucomicrobiota bacterium]